jgi:hypothetical protein
VKIIGIIKESDYAGCSHYIADVTDAELQKLATGSRRLEVGVEIKVSDAFNDLVRFREAHSKLEHAAEVLRAVASLVDTAKANYVLEPPKQEEGAKA